MKRNFKAFFGVLLALVVFVQLDYADVIGQEKPVIGPGQGLFKGYVRTQDLPGSVPHGLKSCRVLVLSTTAYLHVGHPIDSVDTVRGPGVLFADYTTDSSGYYEILLPVGTYKVIFWANSYVPVTEDLTIGPGENAPLFGYYENEKRPIDPGVTVNPWRGGPTHNLLEFEEIQTSPTISDTTSPETTDELVYHHPDWNFSIEKPSADWTLLTGAQAQAEVTEAVVYMELKDMAAASIFVSNIPGVDFEKILVSSIPTLENMKLVSQRDVGFGSVKGMFYEVEGSLEGTLFYWVVASFLHKETVYQIHGWADKSLKPQIERMFNKIISSFKIVEQD